MENKLKAYLSIASIILFVLAAMASFGPDPSTNTSVAIKDCMTEPAFNGTVTITISYKVKPFLTEVNMKFTFRDRMVVTVLSS